MSNMENMLMDSGSSSGESDDEVDVPTGRPAATVAASVPMPAPVAAPHTATPSSAEDQMKARLKNLYQTQNKRPAQMSASQPPSSSTTSSKPGVPMNPHPGMAHPTSVPPSSRPQSRAPSKPLKQTMPASQPRMNIGKQPQPRLQQSVRSPLPAQPGQYSRSTHSGHSVHLTHSNRPSQSSQVHSASQSRPPSHAGVHNPYTTTPLSNIQTREQQTLGRMPSSNSRPSSSIPGSYSDTQSGSGSSQMYSSSSSSRADPTLASREQEIRRQKERFLIFTRVLIKYLEQKDPNMHRQAKLIIKDCAERNKNQEPGYQSVTASMKTRLKELVGESYWRRAEVYLKHYLDQQKNKSGAQGSSSSSTHTLTQQQLNRQKMQQQEQRQRAAKMQAQQRAAQAQHNQQKQQQQQAPNLVILQQEVSNRRSEIVGGVRTPTTAVSPAKGTVAQQKKATAPKGKARAAVAPASRKPGTPVTGAPAEKADEPPQEYLELMQTVDHAGMFDCKSVGQLIKSNKTDLPVNEEQKKLLYSVMKPKQSRRKRSAGPRPGWDRTNVFSARAAWARVRLPEQKTTSNAPVVGGGLLTLPTETAASTNEGSTTWANEEEAEQDIVLAVLSEGCQQYVKGILQKAVRGARQRQNVDGVRLWHQQHMAAVRGKAPALSLRFGCDISRQVAQAAGSAAITCKRMEETLERQIDASSSSRILNDETLEGATSMGDLSLCPQVPKGIEVADLQARRSYELCGGKHSSELPLGRIPKKAKIEKIDLVHGSNLGDNIGRHRAVISSGSTC